MIRGYTHGTWSSYCHRCKCDECREAARKYLANRKSQANKTVEQKRRASVDKILKKYS